jgi:putative zinc finger/helix-turn-helix YgiT family protein
MYEANVFCCGIPLSRSASGDHSMEESMKCEECGGAMTTEPNAVRRYDVGGLPHVLLHGVEVSTCQACGKEEVAIPRIGQLHHVIAMHLVKQAQMLAPVEIRFLRKHTGYSTGEFAQIMGVARETVSRWESGQPMGAVADRLLRVVVLTHEPVDDYAAVDDAAAGTVQDLLETLTDRPIPDNLGELPLRNSGDRWTTTAHAGRLAVV